MQVTASKKEIWTMGSYSLLTLAIMTGFMYLNTFATEVLQIPAGTLATALLIAKVTDFIFSVIHGVVMEKVKLPGNMGKNQSWLYYGRWIVAVCCMLEVTNTTMAPMIVRVVVLSASYIVLNCMMNIIQTAYYGVLAVVAGPNPANRNEMTINMTRQGTVVSLVCSFIPTLVTVLPFGSWNYFVVGTLFVLPMPWALGNIAKLADGKDMPVGAGGAGAPQIGIKDMLDTLLKNPQLLVLFLVNSVLNVATNIYQANYTYYFIYIVGDFTKLTVSTLCSSLVGLGAAIIMPKIGQKLGKKWAMVTGLCLYAGALTCVYLFAATNWILYIVFMSISMCGTYMYMPYTMMMYMDCGEWYLNKTGKDTRTIAMGLSAPPMKIGMALGGSIGLYLLSATGYVAGFTPTAEWVSSFMLICFLVPVLVVSVAILLMIFGYKLTDAEAARCAQENAERAAAAQAQQ